MNKFFFIPLTAIVFLFSIAMAELQERKNGTVMDIATGLMWQQNEAGEMNWMEAMEYCKNLELGGYRDWRLPNCIELRTIIDFSKQSPATNTSVFPHVASARYWSSTPYALHYGIAWTVDFNDGHVSFTLKTTPLYVRAVRGGR